MIKQRPYEIDVTIVDSEYCSQYDLNGHSFHNWDIVRIDSSGDWIWDCTSCGKIVMRKYNSSGNAKFYFLQPIIEELP